MKFSLIFIGIAIILFAIARWNMNKMNNVNNVNFANQEIESYSLEKRHWTGWKMSRRAKLIFIPVFFIAFINFGVFFIVNTYIGGDALNGYIKDGHYFLGNHGAYTEVNKAMWKYSYCHTISIWITHFLVFFLAAIFMRTGDMTPEKQYQKPPYE